MSSREDIIEAVRANRPASVPLPDLPSFDPLDADLTDRFASATEAVGGRVVRVEGDLGAAVATRFPEAAVLASTLDAVPGTVDLSAVDDPHALADVDVLVCRGTLGVAENGAVWLPESDVLHRAAPFLAQHLALVVRRTDLVWDMHAAYDRLRIDDEGFGLFVAGPSKTADIEQSLVVGAHGPRSLTVFLVASVPAAPADSDEPERPR